MSEHKLSVIIITLNEEENIRDCLQSVVWADEIILIDAYSKDNTVKIAKEYTEKIFQVAWKGYSKSKNYALELANNDWILSLDADERVTPELAEEIQSIIKTPSEEISGYQIARRSYFLGKWIRHCGWYPGYTLRLFRKNSGNFINSSVHEYFKINGKVLKLKNDLIHYTDRNISHYFEKYNRYTSLAVEDMIANGKNFRIHYLILKPVITFLKMYILRSGWLDGMQGFILSIFSASYVFTKYAKLWEFKNKINGE